MKRIVAIGRRFTLWLPGGRRIRIEYEEARTDDLRLRPLPAPHQATTEAGCSFP